jgi:hypothetical protein
MEDLMARFLVAVLIGIGLTLAWQSYGEEAKQIVQPWATEMVTTRAPSLAWLLPSSWTKSPPNLDAAAKQTDAAAKQTDVAAKQAGSSPVREVYAEQPAPVIRTAAPPPAAPELSQQFEAMARDLAVLRRSVEQLAAKQEQVVQNIATLQAEIGEKLAPPPAPRAVAPPQTAAPRPASADARRVPSPAR